MLCAYYYGIYFMELERPGGVPCGVYNTCLSRMDERYQADVRFQVDISDRRSCPRGIHGRMVGGRTERGQVLQQGGRYGRRDRSIRQHHTSFVGWATPDERPTRDSRTTSRIDAHVSDGCPRLAVISQNNIPGWACTIMRDSTRVALWCYRHPPD